MGYFIKRLFKSFQTHDPSPLQFGRSVKVLTIGPLLSVVGFALSYLLGHYICVELKQTAGREIEDPKFHEMGADCGLPYNPCKEFENRKGIGKYIGL